ncbi:YfcE family phosphodiesterase [Staphylococcus massiliensis]|uniref:Phosphoesterase n=1 Tax=Staphylococcus massiliensis S46 TaxID=1229783 RepID=K9AG33_9STAP|nr:YfcE family phosphodiesterase [Staphylococcus massiliensis]EKU45056.1 hypothetical protein C273_11717 [Staphylococcus massiliensis S46]MCG3400572.1 YfcE family phosphodiesterase [Staphylococcus massiliensis]MCG3401435.1 YfcE family phosphodiesterase [Staphylococcus massiliensis]MCG3411782.1 YfcE family phosphodiesterase [Staphylococcus massiliensis]PNZ97754.1 YfcE family phosphodiesterase [Staphylococcus massiliensis CCUG 55927]
MGTKKWIIVSDNHNEKGILYDIFEQHRDATQLIHLGDSEFDYDDTELSLYKRVKGNCDFDPNFLMEDNIQENHINAFFTHGHMYNVNSTRQNLALKAKTHNAQFAFYGHTHVAKHEIFGTIHVINPGSISQSRSDVEETYAELIINTTTHTGLLNLRNRNHEVIDHKKLHLSV